MCHTEKQTCSFAIIYICILSVSPQAFFSPLLSGTLGSSSDASKIRDVSVHLGQIPQISISVPYF